MTRAELGNLLSDRRVELADLKTVTEYVADLHGTLNEGSLAERKSFVRSIVKEVRITGDQALLICDMPLSTGRVSQESLGVPPNCPPWLDWKGPELRYLASARGTALLLPVTCSLAIL